MIEGEGSTKQGETNKQKTKASPPLMTLQDKIDEVVHHTLIH